MSIQTWKQEFYPTTAEQAAQRGQLAAIKHCLKKWEGLRQENLERHGVCASGKNILICDAIEEFDIDADSCALCVRHDSDCSTCELAAARDGLDCCLSDAMEWSSPFETWRAIHDPEPMIFWLVKTLVDSK